MQPTQNVSKIFYTYIAYMSIFSLLFIDSTNAKV